eukprot:3963939-Pyramimonas_sp.AAC.1
MVHYLDPEVIEESTTCIFHWISKVYQIISLDSMKELSDFTNDAIYQTHPALNTLRALFTNCIQTHGNPGFPVWREP